MTQGDSAQVAKDKANNLLRRRQGAKIHVANCVLLLLALAGRLGAQQGSIRTGNASHAAPAELEVYLQRELAAHPRSFEANHRLGEYYLQAGKLQTGIPFLEAAARLDPAQYVNRYDLALAYLETGNFTEARRQLRAMLAGKNTAEVHSLLGEVEEKSGNYVAAGNEYQIAAHLEPSEKNIFDWGNELLLHRGFDPALKVFSSGVERYPKSAMLHLGLGVAYYSLSLYDDAAKALCRASDLAPSDSRPYLILGRMFDISSHEADEITKRLRRFQETQPKNALANYYYAMSLWKGRRGQSTPGSPVAKDDIRRLLERAKSLDPKFPDAPFQLGVLDVEEHKYQEAIREFQQAVRLKPHYAEAHYHLAQAYAHAGEKALASSEYELYQRFHKEEMAEDVARQKRIGQLVYRLQGSL